MYNVLLILLHRPFVSDGHLYHNARSKTVNSLLTCVTAATKIVNLLKAYHQAFSIQRAPYLISYATYVSATIHVRIAAQRGPSSEAHKCLATCLTVLQLNQGTNSAAERANTIVEGLMKKLNVTVLGVDHDLDNWRSSNGHAHHGTVSFPRGRASANLEGETPSFSPGFSPGFDVDAVIQSFAPPSGPRNDAKDGQSRNFPEHLNNFVVHGGVQGQPASFNDAREGWNVPSSNNQQLYPQSTLGHPDSWMQNWQFSAYSTDDLLFGFNGSATDGFYIPDAF